MIAASRSATPSPSPPHQTKVSRLPFGPGSPEEAKPRTGRPSSLGRAGDGEDRLAAVGGVADDAPADPLAAELELRLDHRQDLAPGARGSAATAGRILVSEMKETSTVARSGTNGRSAGSQVAGVEALDHGHARILAQTRSICP